MDFYQLSLRLYRFQKYAEAYLRYYPRFFWWKFFLICNEFFNKKIYFLAPLPEIAHLDSGEERKELDKLKRSLRQRYLRFQYYDLYIKYRMAKLVDKSGESRQMREIFEQVDEGLLSMSAYYHYLWQKEKQTKLDSQREQA